MDFWQKIDFFINKILIFDNTLIIDKKKVIFDKKNWFLSNNLIFSQIVWFFHKILYFDTKNPLLLGKILFGDFPNFGRFFKVWLKFSSNSNFWKFRWTIFGQISERCENLDYSEYSPFCRDRHVRIINFNNRIF